MARKSMEDVVVHHTDPRQGATLPVSTQNNVKYSSNPVNADRGRIENNPFFEKVKPNPERPQKQKKTSRTWLWVGAIMFFAIAAFLVANYFASATVEITPLTYSAHLEHDFVAVKGNIVSGNEPSTQLFHFISSTDEKSIDVPATTEQKIQKKAFGKVAIYNSYSKDSQRLIKNTRLESADHKIFRIVDSVVVPGAKIVAGKISRPGMVEVLAIADAPGAEYNIGLGDFTIPGFKGDPRYTKSSAHSITSSPIAGGFSGTVKIPDESVVLKAQEDLKKDLKTSSVEKARALIPPGMSFFPGSMVIKFEEVPQDFAAGDTAKITVKATVAVFFFDTELITQKFAEVSLPNYQGNPVTISNMSAIGFTFLDPVDKIVLGDLAQIRFHVVGDLIFVGKIDNEKIRTDLVGKDKKDFGKIIITEQNISKAEATVRPMWRASFPLDRTKITVDVMEVGK